MIISKETYDKCCPSYKEAVDILEMRIAQINNSNVNDVTKFTQLFPAVVHFSLFYFTPAEYWNFIMPKLGKDLPINRVEFWKKLCRHIAQWALLNLCYNTEWTEIKYMVQDDDGTSVYYFNAYDDKHLKLLNFKNDFYLLLGKRTLANRGFVLNFLRNLIPAGTPEFRPYIVTKQDLEYPHNRLQECMEEYKKISFFNPSAKITKQYQEMKPLYHKIKSVENNVEEWFNVLLEVNDVSFVMHNVECRLGKSLFNIKLWKLYISFLEEHGEYSRLLDVSHLYCHFFMDDKEMKEKHKTRMERYGISGYSLYAFPQVIHHVEMKNFMKIL